jgi:hypothetical protein
MSWIIYLKFLSAWKFVLIEYLTFIYIFAYFFNAIWLFYQLIIHACSEAKFREKYFTTNFSPVSDFQCEASRRTYSYVRTSVVLPYTILAVAIWTVKWHVRTGSLQVKDLCLFLCHTHVFAFLLIYHGMLCVFLVDLSWDFGILYTSLLIQWSSLCLSLFF